VSVSSSRTSDSVHNGPRIQWILPWIDLDTNVEYVGVEDVGVGLTPESMGSGVGRVSSKGGGRCLG